MPPKKRRRIEKEDDDSKPLKKIGITRRRYKLSIPCKNLKSGKVFICGMGECGQLGLGMEVTERKELTPNESLENIVDICAGGMHTLCLNKHGEIFSFGCNDEGALGRMCTQEGSEFEAKKVLLPGNAVKISAGDSHSACLLEDGRVFAWGTFRNCNGSMGLTVDGVQKQPIEIMMGIKCCDIASGANHIVILSCNGKAYTIGCGDQGQLGRVSNRVISGKSRNSFNYLLKPSFVVMKFMKHINAIWASTYCTFLEESETKKIWAFGLNNYKQIAINLNEEIVLYPRQWNFENVMKICGGQHHTLILTEKNECYIIGRRDYGLLGLGMVESDIVEPTLVNSLKDETIVDISCGEMVSFAINTLGNIYAWGMGTNYQLGTGNSNDSLEPVQIQCKEVDKQFLNVKSGGQHTIFLAGKVFECNEIKNEK